MAELATGVAPVKCDHYWQADLTCMDCGAERDDEEPAARPLSEQKEER